MGHKRRGSPVEKAVLDTPIACNAAFLWGFNPRLGAKVLNRCPKRVPFQLAAIIAHPSDEHVMPSKVIFAKRFRLRFVVLMRQGRSRVWIRDLTPWKRKVRDPKIVKPRGERRTYSTFHLFGYLCGSRMNSSTPPERFVGSHWAFVGARRRSDVRVVKQAVWHRSVRVPDRHVEILFKARSSTTCVSSVERWHKVVHQLKCAQRLVKRILSVEIQAPRTLKCRRVVGG